MCSLAENYFKQHKFPEAATLYEAEAERTRDIAEKVLLYNKAASTYHEYGSQKMKSGVFSQPSITFRTRLMFNV